MVLKTKSKIQWKHIRVLLTIIGVILLITSFVIIGVEWDNIVAQFNNNGVLTASFLASMGVSFLSLTNILFGIILKIIQSKIERNKNNTTRSMLTVMKKTYRVAHDTTISSENKVKMILKELEHVQFDDSKKSQ